VRPVIRATLFDYGAGNLHSLAKALARPGWEVRTSDDPARAVETDLLVLPGVGAFPQAAARLAAAHDLRRRVGEGLPVLGICLGMQLLFEASEEGTGEGLGVLAGRVTRLAADRVPQIGWNGVTDARDPRLGAPDLSVYYANSFACRPADEGCVAAWCRYGADRFPAAVRRGRVAGFQFHPEKSGARGVALLRAFAAELAA
jgi:glutamine amidotransferase